MTYTNPFKSLRIFISNSNIKYLYQEIVVGKYLNYTVYLKINRTIYLKSRFNVFVL